MALVNPKIQRKLLRMNWQLLILLTLICLFKASVTNLKPDPLVEQVIAQDNVDTNQAIKKVCPTGQFADSNGLCTICDSNCQTCSETATNCLSCSINKILNSFKKCQACPENQVIQNNKCIQCEYYQFVNQNSVCQNCATGCAKCSGSSQNCTTCEPITHIYDGKLNTCTPCAGQCLSCQGTVENCTSKASLDVNYVGSSNYIGDNYICKINCIQCAHDEVTGETACKVALDGFSIDQNGKIIKCINGCSMCSTTTPNECYRCFEGFARTSQKICQACDQSCFSCNNSTTCVTCHPGNFLNNITGLCSVCLVQNCLQCSSETECSTCKDGFLIVKATKQCTECQPNCGICDPQNVLKCVGCWDGFYLNGTTNCVACPVGCSICSNETAIVCTNCISGYVLGTQNSKICFQSCVFPCVTCIDGHPSSCLSCTLGYKFVNNTCTPDIQCNSASECSVCPLGYALIESNCITCSVNNCGQCEQVDRDTCDACNKGYYLKNNTCVKCPAGCSSCISDKKCFSCMEGYTFTQNYYGNSISPLCYKCHESCASCNFLPTQCVECAVGYNKIGRKCVSQYVIQYNVALEYEGQVQSFINNQYYVYPIKNILDLARISQNDANTLIGIWGKSITVSGIIGVKLEDQCDKFTKLSQSLAKGNTIGELTILSTTLYSTKNACQNNLDNWIFKNILIALLVLLGILIIALIVRISGFKCQNKPYLQIAKEKEGLRQETIFNKASTDQI